MPFDLLQYPGALGSSPVSDAVTLHVRMPDGGILLPSGTTGQPVLAVLQAFGVPIRFEATGRILSHQSSLSPHVEAGTCRLEDLVLTSELDGAEIELSWDALVPQTYWVAG